MNPWLFGLIVFVVVFLILLHAAFCAAPYGHEDETGFHYDRPPTDPCQLDNEAAKQRSSESARPRPGQLTNVFHNLNRRPR